MNKRTRKIFGVLWRLAVLVAGALVITEAWNGGNIAAFVVSSLLTLGAVYLFMDFVLFAPCREIVKSKNHTEKSE